MKSHEKKGKGKSEKENEPCITLGSDQTQRTRVRNYFNGKSGWHLNCALHLSGYDSIKERSLWLRRVLKSVGL